MAGIIKKLQDKELVGGKDSTDVYPITHVRAVYDSDGISIEELVAFLKTKGMTFMGEAAPTTDPGVPQFPVFYVALVGGRYQYFGNIDIVDGTSFIMYRNKSWTSVSLEDFLSLSKTYLRKDQDDTSVGIITSTKGFQVGNYAQGSSGAIFNIENNEQKHTYLEVDKLKVRLKAYFETLEIINVNTVGGKQIISPAGSIECSSVEIFENEGYYRCHFITEQDGSKIKNRFVVGDLAYSQMFNANTGVVNNISNTYYWREVVGVGEDYIDLSISSCDEDSDIPKEGDIICQRGNKNDTDRQSLIEFSAVDEYSPSIILYQGINSFSLTNEDGTSKEMVAYGYDTTTGRAFFREYGDAYIGAKDKSTYIKYTQDEGVEILGKLSGSSTFKGSTLEDYINSTANNIANNVSKENIDSFASSTLKDQLSDIQKQVDGAIETWFYEGEPTLNNYPANEWKTDNSEQTLKNYNVHLGDLYYDRDTGKCYRFQITDTENNIYGWNVITDTDIQAAMDAAAKAQDTADSKRKVFVKQPTYSDYYDVGDLWVNAIYPASTGNLYNDVLLRCKTAKNENEDFDINHWVKASNWTDNSELESFKEEYSKNIESIKEQIDSKAETWYQDEDPSSNWTDDETKKLHEGDLWYCTDSKNTDKYQKTFYYSNGAWIEQSIPDEVFDKIDGKSTIFTSKPSSYEIDDLWFLEDSYKLHNGVTYSKGEMVVAINTSKTFNAEHWEKKTKYTDDTALTTFINGDYSTYKNNIQSQIDKKAETWYQSTDPSKDWTTNELKEMHVGDLWYDSTSGVDKTYYYSSDYKWVQQNVPTEVFDQIDGKSSIFTSQPSSYEKNDLWILSENHIINGISYIAGTILTAINETKRTAYNAADWVEKVCYTDDTALTVFINGSYKDALEDIQAQIDEKAETYYQESDPKDGWDKNEYSNHVGDLWYNTSNGTTWYFDGTKWQQQDIPSEVFDRIDGKSSIFVSKPSSYNENDIWILSLADSKLSELATLFTLYTVGDILTASEDSSAFNVKHWSKLVKYTDDTAVDNLKSTYDVVIGPEGYIVSALKESFLQDGGLYLGSYISLGTRNESLKTHISYAGLNGIFNSELRGNGIAFWAGGESRDLWDVRQSDGSFNTNGERYAMALDRMDGTGYRANGKFWWDENGNIYVDGNYFKLDGESLSYLPASFKNDTDENGTSIITSTKILSTVGIRIGEAYLYWDSTNRALRLVHPYNKFATSFFATGDIVASTNSDYSSSGSSGGSTTLSGLTDTTITSATSGNVLVFNGTHWVNKPQSEIVPDLTGYATETWVVNRKYLTASDVTGKVDTVATSGSGNAVTSASISGSTLTLKKESTFSLSSHTHGYVSTVKVGDTSYSASNNIITLPAYPTSMAWSAITDKPSTYTPSSHTHTKSQVTDFPTTWAWDSITGKPSTYSPSSHTHSYASSITIGSSTTKYSVSDNNINIPAYPSSMAWSAITGKPSTYTPSSHTHEITDIASLKSLKTSTSITNVGWSGNSTDDYILPTMSFMAFWNGAYNASNTSNLTYCNRGAFGTIVTKSTSDYLSSSTTYAGSSSIGGAATSANKLNTDAGSSTLPVYFSNGVPVAVNTTGIGISITGSAAKLGTTTIGDTSTPIYLNAGTATKCSHPVSGNWFNGIPYINSSGVMEVGSYIDFHAASANTTDYDVRLTASSSNLNISTAIVANGISSIKFDDYTGLKLIRTSASKGSAISFYNNGGSTLLGTLGVAGGGSLCYDSPSVSNALEVTTAGDVNLNGTLGFYNRSTGDTALGVVGIDSDGYLYYNSASTTNAFKVDKSGNFIAAGDVTASSDIRYKDIVYYINKVDYPKISNAPLFIFKWKGRNEDIQHLGTSAQYWKKVFPELVFGEDKLSLNYSVLGTTLGVINSRREDELEEKISKLQKENEEIKKELQELKKIVYELLK
jgi:hypothetical protein